MVLRTKLGIGLMTVASMAAGIPRAVGQEATQPDNTKVNKGDSNKMAATADDQKNNKSDIQITADIRKAIVDDSSLSMYAHNIKIVTKHGAVTLKGPVRSAEEKSTIEAKAKEVAGAAKVTNKITVAPEKKEKST